MGLICICGHYNTEHRHAVGKCETSGCTCMHWVSPPPMEKLMHLDPDEAADLRIQHNKTKKEE